MWRLSSTLRKMLIKRDYLDKVTHTLLSAHRQSRPILLISRNLIVKLYQQNMTGSWSAAWYVIGDLWILNMYATAVAFLAVISPYSASMRQIPMLFKNNLSLEIFNKACFIVLCKALALEIVHFCLIFWDWKECTLWKLSISGSWDGIWRPLQ